ncbi:MAG: TIGR03936 family radical SAM-associated protein, partial [Sciscionella sp.]
HRDFARAFERALVRAGLPVAYSSGFHPHPRISFAGAAPTGAASEAEYLEVGLGTVSEPELVRDALDRAMPDGLDVVAVTGSSGRSLAELLEASRWRVEVPGLSTEAAAAAVRRFLEQESVRVERMTKKGVRSFDCRAAVVSLAVGQHVGETGKCAILDLVLRHGTPSVRPDDVLAGVRTIAGLEAGPAPIHERLAQGPLDPRTGTVGDPLTPHRDTG